MMWITCKCTECGGSNFTFISVKKGVQKYPLSRVCDYCKRLFLIDEKGKPYSALDRFLDERVI